MIPFSPCGMVFDVITVPYECRFRLWTDPTRTVKGYWLYAPAGAKDFPAPPVIRPLVWTHDPVVGDEYHGLIGEVPNSRKQLKGKPPKVHGDGQHFCGKLEWFTDGKVFGTGPDNLERNFDGTVECCGVREGQVGHGRDGDDGLAVQFLGTFQAAAGGDADNGQVVQFIDYFQAAAGGDADNGQVVQFIDYFQAAAGGDADDGIAIQFIDYFQAAAGGDADDGTAVQGETFTQVASGGDADDGTAVQFISFVQLASGGDSDDGTAVQTLSGGGGTTPFGGCPAVPTLLNISLLTDEGGCLDGVEFEIEWDGTEFYGEGSGCGGATITARMFEFAEDDVRVEVLCNGVGIEIVLGVDCGPPYSAFGGDSGNMGDCGGLTMVSATIGPA